MELLWKRLANLLTVKSVVTLCLTAVFAYLCLTGQANSNLEQIYLIIIAFYFGTQTGRDRDTNPQIPKQKPHQEDDGNE